MLSIRSAQDTLCRRLNHSHSSAPPSRERRCPANDVNRLRTPSKTFSLLATRLSILEAKTSHPAVFLTSRIPMARTSRLLFSRSPICRSGLPSCRSPNLLGLLPSICRPSRHDRHPDEAITSPIRVDLVQGVVSSTLYLTSQDPREKFQHRPQGLSL